MSAYVTLPYALITKLGRLVIGVNYRSNQFDSLFRTRNPYSSANPFGLFRTPHKKETMSDDGEEIRGFVEAVESFFISGRNGDDVLHSDGKIISVSFSLCILCRDFEFFLLGLGNFESKFEVHESLHQNVFHSTMNREKS
ncbi:hypothetical protein YC2023_024231 [Brassica napus]